MIGIYKITNKINNKVYIGQSKLIEKRWKEHLADYERKDTKLYFAFRKYGIENFLFEIIEECSIEELNEREIFWIKQYNSYNEGYNMDLGGAGNPKYDYNYIIEQYKIFKTVEDTAKHCGCHIHTVSRALKACGVPVNANSSGKPRPIKQIDLKTLEVIAVYNSIADAMKALNISNNASISRVLNGTQKSAYGYGWIDVDCNENQIKNIFTDKNNHCNQKLLQLDLQTNQIIAEFNSVSETKEALKRKRVDDIYKVCKGERKSAYGYGWKFIDKEF